jgi:hypothetical protein
MPHKPVYISGDHRHRQHKNLQAFEAVRTFEPMDQAHALLDRSREAAAKRLYERYETTNQNDSTAINPGG